MKKLSIAILCALSFSAYADSIPLEGGDVLPTAGTALDVWFTGTNVFPAPPTSPFTPGAIYNGSCDIINKNDSAVPIVAQTMSYKFNEQLTSFNVTVNDNHAQGGQFNISTGISSFKAYGMQYEPGYYALMQFKNFDATGHIITVDNCKVWQVSK